MKRYILYMIAAMLFTSCNEWLDVKSETEDKEEDIFAKQSGFKNALTGIYMSMAERSIYGENLTMSSVEELGCVWYCDDFNYNPAFYYLHKHDYTNDYAKGVLKNIYHQLFFTITQTNVLLKNIHEHGEALQNNSRLRLLIEGEAYAVRALCQFDVLRLFGQIPGHKGSVNVKLPYSFTTKINDLPVYYDYDSYVKLIKEDVAKALEDLRVSDPVMDYPLNRLNSIYDNLFEDDFYYFRCSRLNYWAVKALEARMDLYLGDTDKAFNEAMEVIQATTTNGASIVTKNADSDLANSLYTLPSEHLFALSKFDVFSYSNSLFVGNGTAQVTPNKHLVLSQEMLNALFLGSDISANNRYLRLWNKNAATNQGVIYPCLCKYYFNTSGNTPSTITQTLIPMIRLSEMYLIAMETTNDIATANTLYYDYMRDRKITIESDHFKQMDEVGEEVMKEYRREFIGEGHIFYTYKRKFANDMQWRDNDDQITESDYIIPLPDTEYEN
ncbi:MAG: RagB/SusD family nutrient uptake outer membrane protein [Prevotella sp.]|nr:RagB/SusD family nutrient uptake outer membrane protein [Prevotella sp.]